MDILGLIALARSKGGGSGSGTFVPSFGTLATIQTGVSWFGDDPYTLTVLVSGYTVTDKTMISILPSVDVIEQMMADGVTNIFITNSNGTLTATAVGGAPTTAMTLQVLCSESDQVESISALPEIVGDGVLETLQATNLTEAINELASNKQDAPETAGTAGQVLGLDSQLQPVWVNKGGGSGGAVDDVQINGTSILSNGVANIPIANTNSPGVAGVNQDYGTGIYSRIIYVRCANSTDIKQASHGYRPIAPAGQHESVFYGLAKAAGDSTQSASANAVGTYTEAAKTAIRAMLGVTDSAGGMNVVTLTGTNITQTAAENTMYKCGELAELTFTAPASGITAVRFSSGSTPTVASFPGVTWLGDFDPDHLLANVTYEINIFDGVGVAGWA